MSIFEPRGPFLFFTDEMDKSEEEAQQEEEKIQEQLCELMYMQQQYHGVIKEQRYALRDSKLRCQYGTCYARLDCIEDNGILRRRFPLFTVLNCTTENIHSFGSCLCPEANYMGRLPMTVASSSKELKVVQADCNVFPHICVPLIGSKDQWKQIDEDLLVETNAQGYAPMLMDNAVLVCQYGGIIFICDVPDVEEDEEEVLKDYGIEYDLDDDEKLFVAVVAGESIGEGELGWKIVANVIMNRVGSAEWSRYTTPRAVMEKEGAFTCMMNGGSREYNKAKEYLENRVDDGGIYEQLIATVMPIYHGEVEDITGGAQLYYSPKSMTPPGSEPWWAPYYRELSVEGIDPNDFVIFSGERIE